MLRRRTELPSWLPAVALLAASVTSNAFDIDDIERFNYINNTSGKPLLVWHNGYVHLPSQLASLGLGLFPLPVQAVAYRALALLMGLLLYHQLRRLFRAWHGRGVQTDVTALTTALMVNLIEPALFGNLAWLHWSALLTAVAYLLATGTGGPARPPLASIAVTLALMTTPLGLLAVPLLFVGAPAGVRPQPDRWIAAAGILLWHGFQAQANRDAWLPEPQPIAELIAAQFAGGWGHNVVIGFAAALLLTATAAAATRARRRAIEHGLLWWLGCASLLAFVTSPTLADQGFEPRYVLVPAFCALLAILEQLGPRRQFARAFVVTTMLLTLVTFAVDRRGPLMSWLDKVRFTFEAERFRGACEIGTAVSSVAASDDALVIECRPQPRPPGEYPIAGARPVRGGDAASAARGPHPIVVVPEPVFGRADAGGQ